VAISDIVAVSIAIQDSAPKAVAFDTPVIVAKAPFVGSRLYAVSPSGLASMVTDGFATYSRAYQIMSALSAQTGGVGRAYVWSRVAQQTQIVDFTVDITKTAVGSVLSFDLSYQGVTSTIEVTVVTNTVNDILDLVEAAIDASAAGLAGVGVAPDNATATKLTLTADTAGDFFLIDLDGEQAISLEDVSTAGTAFATELAAMKASLGESAYGLLIDGFSETEINLAATFALANSMLFLGQSADAEILESGQTDDVASDLDGANNTRAAVCFTRNMSGDWAAGLLGQMLAVTPGSATWAFKQIAGATADTLTTTHFNAARAKHALLYTTDRGEAHTWDGFAASGRYFDVTHGADFLKADIETRVYQQFLNRPKIPFNATGLSIIESAIRGALGASEAAGLIEPGWFVTMPSLVGYSSVDKAARLLRTVEFSAVLTGAVHSVTVAGTLTL
jgi:hypothetical protein